MTQPDRMELFRASCDEFGQAEVARRIGYSASAVNQALKGTYGGDLTNLLTAVETIFGQTMVSCPILGDISLGRCTEQRKKPFAATNPTRVRLFRTCPTCTVMKGGK